MSSNFVRSDEVDQMLALQREGKSTRDIAAATGRHIRTVQIELRNRARMLVARRRPVHGGWFGRCPAFRPRTTEDANRPTRL